MALRKRTEPVSAGDRKFFQDFYEAQKGFLFYIARQYTTSQSDCEDLVQEALVRLMNNIPTLKTLNANQTAKYIAVTVKSAYLDMEKRRYAVNEILTGDDILTQLLEKNCLDSEDGSVSTAILSLKQALSKRDWLVLEGKYILGYDREELSQLIGVRPDSIRMILSRARSKAKSILLCGDENGGECNG